MKKVILNGCLGRMGRVIDEILEQSNSLELVGGVDYKEASDLRYPVASSFDALNIKADVIIDFSNPCALDMLLEYAIKTKTAVVIATTGYTQKQIEQIKEASISIPVFFSFNMSLGVNLLVNLAKKAAGILGEDFDIEIIEKHHNQKIDAPSGTAIMIAEALNENKNMQYEYDRHSKRQKRSKNEIGIHSVRGGTIVGEHDVIFAGNNEVVTLSHQAYSRSVFATGAIHAASFIADKENGLYDMNALIESN